MGGLTQAFRGPLMVGLVLGGLLLGLLVDAPAASAHTTIESVTPSAGSAAGGVVDELEITFYVEVKSPMVTVTSPSGETVDGTVELADPQTLRYIFDPLTEVGEYIVEWSVVTPDTHRDAAAYAFRFNPEAGGWIQRNWPMVAGAAAVTFAIVLGLTVFTQLPSVGLFREPTESGAHAGSS